MEKKKITFVDLFSGIGGFHLGIKQAAKKLKMEGECLLAVDIDHKARKTYQNYFKINEKKLLDDITDEKVRNLVPNNVDIICAGFPCQPFSLVGKKNGFDDNRGTLFDYIDKVITAKKPKAVFLENVRNIVSLNEGKILQHIIKRLNKIGYNTALERGKNWEILKASQFGLPTYRPRFYLIAFKSNIKKAGDFRFPQPTTLNEVKLKDFFGKKWPNTVGSTIRVGGRMSPFKKMPDGSWFRDRRNWDTYLVNNRPHVLTVDEAKLMMGFPSDFKFPEELSETQAMKQIGNSVAVPVIKAIAENIIKTIYG